MKINNGVYLLLIAIILTSCHEAPENIIDINSFIGEPKGIIIGFVINTDSLALEGAEVTITQGNLNYTTDDKGNFETSQINVGMYNIEIEHPDYQTYYERFSVEDGVIDTLYFEMLDLGSVDIKFVFVSEGSFEMGDVWDEGNIDEKPVHTVTIDDFYLSKFEVTNEQFVEFLNQNGNGNEGGENWLNMNDSDCRIYETDGTFYSVVGYEKHPVTEVTWYGARAFCEWAGGRLPTEAEWEYAARGGDLSQLYLYSGSDDVNEIALIDIGDTYQIGTKKGNELGLFDMSGNVWEWCADLYNSEYYSESPNTDPPGPVTGSSRVLRGGSWYNYPNFYRSSNRYNFNPSGSESYMGFRVALD